MTELWKDMEFTVVDEHNKQGIIFHKGTDFYMEQDFKNGWLRCELNRVWSFFHINKGLEEPETQDFLLIMVEEHLKCQTLTPWTLGLYLDFPEEEHLKFKALTPTKMHYGSVGEVEEHLKHKLKSPLTTSMNYLRDKLEQWWKNISIANIL